MGSIVRMDPCAESAPFNKSPKWDQVKGAGVFDLAKVEIEFSVVSDRGECQLPDAFDRIKKYCS